MNNKTEQKINNLRNLLNGKTFTMDELHNLTFRNDELPSIQTLKKYGLLELVEEEEIFEVSDGEDLDSDCDYYGWIYNYEEDRYEYREVIRYYKIV